MRVNGKSMVMGVAAALPAMVAGAMVWGRVRSRDEELYLEEYETPEDPRFTYDGTL